MSSPLGQVLATSCALWGDAYVRASHALGVMQQVVDDQAVRLRVQCGGRAPLNFSFPHLATPAGVSALPGRPRRAAACTTSAGAVGGTPQRRGGCAGWPKCC